MTKNNSKARRSWRSSRIPIIREAHKKWDIMTTKINALDPHDPALNDLYAKRSSLAGAHRLHMRMTADYKPGTFAGDR